MGIDWFLIEVIDCNQIEVFFRSVFSLLVFKVRRYSAASGGCFIYWLLTSPRAYFINSDGSGFYVGRRV